LNKNKNMTKKQKDMSWLLDDEDNNTLDVVDANGVALES
jgi:hypothetical protein